ncbi:MAG: hypothetical protein A2Y25_07740 [Candidatus Melainabacteria bacterium GWF2_37_15]|nr:MAG: hypothetical protein A2Y25_07740 [Candidatus Melainabacteria bacterium GWF2_37_15]
MIIQSYKPIIHCAPQAPVKKESQPYLIQASSLPCISPVCFMASRTKRSGKSYIVDTSSNNRLIIQQDAKFALGEEPFLFNGHKKKEEPFLASLAKVFEIEENYTAKWLENPTPMIKKGEIFRGLFSDIKDNTLYYAVYYKDTKKWDDNNGKGYKIKHKD